MENPWKTLSSINPQRENGHREINNDIWAALIRANFTAGEYKVIMTVIDRSWGFNLSSAQISLSQFERITLLSRAALSRSIKSAEAKRAIVCQRHERVAGPSYHKGGTTEYLFNKHYDTWVVSIPQYTNSPRGVSVPDDTKLVSPSIPSWYTPVYQVSIPATPTGEPVKKLIKETIKETTKEIVGIYDHWNSKKIIEHRRLIEPIKQTISGALRNYKYDELILAIDNYAEIIFDDRYFFKYRWPLKDFLRRGVDKFLDGDIARKNYLTDKGKKRRPGRVPTAAELEEQKRRLLA